MPHWFIKSAIQRVIAALPARQRWNEFFQEYGTKSLQLTPERFTCRLEHCRRHLDNFAEGRDGEALPGFTAIELGTGWYPVPTLGFYLCGAREVWTVDIDPLLKPARMQRMIALLLDLDQRGELRKYLPRLLPERIAKLREHAPLASREKPEVFLERFNINVLVRDAQTTGLPPATIDLFCSTSVLQYISREVLRGILKEFSRLATPRSVMSHWINLVDQFSYFDKSITPYNFLKYGERQWRWFNSPLTWQNRLRISDYKSLIQESGFKLVREESESGNSADLEKIKLAPDFSHYSKADLLVLTSWLVARKSRTE